MAFVIHVKCEVIEGALDMLHPFHALHRCPSFFPASSGPWRGGLRTHRWWAAVTEWFSPPFPGMIGYGMAKGAVHQLCQSLAGKTSGMPPRSAAIAVLP